MLATATNHVVSQVLEEKKNRAHRPQGGAHF